MGRYDDMLDLPRPAMPRAKPLTGAERAAQFSPFAALSGYEAAIREAARLTEPAVELAEDGAAALDEKLRLLVEHLPRRPLVTVTWFEPDAKKEGGAFRVFTGRLRRVDEAAGLLLFEGGQRLPLAAVRGLESEIFPEFL